jgi:hypothetical protein
MIRLAAGIITAITRTSHLLAQVRRMGMPKLAKKRRDGAFLLLSTGVLQFDSIAQDQQETAVHKHSPNMPQTLPESPTLPEAPPFEPQTEPDPAPVAPPERKPDLSPFDPDWPEGRPEPQPKA